VATGEEVEVRPPAGATAFWAQGVFSPDGRLLAVPVRTGSTWQLALVDVGAGTATRITGAAVQQDSVIVDWSAAGETVFLAGGRRGDQKIFAYRLGTASARRLPVEVGDFFGMAAA
jgi:Tol biopolymer transport system component